MFRAPAIYAVSIHLRERQRDTSSPCRREERSIDVRNGVETWCIWVTTRDSNCRARVKLRAGFALSDHSLRRFLDHFSSFIDFARPMNQRIGINGGHVSVIETVPQAIDLCNGVVVSPTPVTMVHDHCVKLIVCVPVFVDSGPVGLEVFPLLGVRVTISSLISSLRQRVAARLCEPRSVDFSLASAFDVAKVVGVVFVCVDYGTGSCFLYCFVLLLQRVPFIHLSHARKSHLSSEVGCLTAYVFQFVQCLCAPVLNINSYTGRPAFTKGICIGIRPITSVHCHYPPI